MADPKLHRRGAPAGWINAREIAATTGFRMSAVINMLASRKETKRDPTIHTRVIGKKWVDIPGGGMEHRDVWEKYEAFPGLSWPYRPQTVTHEDFFRFGGSDKFCLPEPEGLDVIRRCRAYREAANLYVPHLPDGFFDGATDADAEMTRDERIIHAMRTYPADGRRTKRQGWPYLRDLRRHADIGDITAADRKRLWPQVGES